MIYFFFRENAIVNAQHLVSFFSINTSAIAWTMPFRIYACLFRDGLMTTASAKR